MPHAIVIDINTLRTSVDIEATQGADVSPFAGMIVPVKTVIDDLLELGGSVKVVLLHDSGAENFAEMKHLVHVNRGNDKALMACLEDCSEVNLFHQLPVSHQARIQGSVPEHARLAKVISSGTGYQAKVEYFPSMEELVKQRADRNAKILAKCKTNLHFTPKELMDFAQGLNGVVADKETQSLLISSAKEQQGGVDARTMLFYQTMGNTGAKDKRAEGAVFAGDVPDVVKELKNIYDHYEKQLTQTANAALS